MRRRMIPPAAAIVVLALALTPVWGGWPGDQRANRWTLALLGLVFGFKAVLFGWMRRRMGDGAGGRTLTVFGMALRDFFLALILLAVALGAFFAIFAYASWRGAPLAFWQITTLRAALASTAALAIATGVAVGWEMSRAESRLAVHEPANALPPGVEFDRRKGPQAPVQGD